MKEIVIGEYFWLPRVGPEVFTKLTRGVGLKYDKAKGFRADTKTNLFLLESALKSILNDEVEFIVTCSQCGKKVECPTCNYRDMCDRRRVSPKCICDECGGKEEVFALYSAGFLARLEE